MRKDTGDGRRLCEQCCAITRTYRIEGNGVFGMRIIDAKDNRSVVLPCNVPESAKAVIEFFGGKVID